MNKGRWEKQPDILFLYGPDWDAPAQLSKHHFAKHWSKKGRVLFVEAPPNTFSFLTRTKKAFRSLRRSQSGPLPIESGFWVRSFLYPLPYRGSRMLTGGLWVNRLNQKVVLPQLRNTLDDLKFENPILFACSAHCEPIVNRIPHSLLAYHCSDDYTAVPGFPRTFQAVESMLIRKADVVICTSEELRRARLSLNPNSYTVTNGADLEHFASVQDPATEVAAEIKKIPGPVIGYVGSVFRWLEQEWIEVAARELKASFVFIGPIETDVSRLKKLDNVFFLGPLPYQQLPGYMKGFQVAIIPFVRDAVTLKASPIKFYEYLAAGLPVVATRLPDLVPLANVACLVESRDAFVEALRRELVQGVATVPSERMEAVRLHSWNEKCSQIEAILRRTFRHKFSQDVNAESSLVNMLK